MVDLILECRLASLTADSCANEGGGIVGRTLNWGSTDRRLFESSPNFNLCRARGISFPSPFDAHKHHLITPSYEFHKDSGATIVSELGWHLIMPPLLR